MASVPSDLSKLTVPQLKALCKERRITGYSKLSKAALLQRLAEVASPTKTTSPPSAIHPACRQGPEPRIYRVWNCQP